MMTIRANSQDDMKIDLRELTTQIQNLSGDKASSSKNRKIQNLANAILTGLRKLRPSDIHSSRKRLIESLKIELAVNLTSAKERGSFTCIWGCFSRIFRKKSQTEQCLNKVLKQLTRICDFPSPKKPRATHRAIPRLENITVLRSIPEGNELEETEGVVFENREEKPNYPKPIELTPGSDRYMAIPQHISKTLHLFLKAIGRI